MAVQAGLTDSLDQIEACTGRRRAGFDLFTQGLVEQRQGDAHRHRHRFGCCRKEFEIATQQRALGEDRHRRTRIGERANDAGHQPVPALGPVVGVGVGSQSHGLTLPTLAHQLFSQHCRDIHLDHYLGVEVTAGIEIEVFVGGTRETVDTLMEAAPGRVDGPAKRHLRTLRNLVQRALAQHLMERDPVEVGGAHRPDQPGAAQAGQRRRRIARLFLVSGVQQLPFPPHAQIRTRVLFLVKPTRPARAVSYSAAAGSARNALLAGRAALSNPASPPTTTITTISTHGRSGMDTRSAPTIAAAPATP